MIQTFFNWLKLDAQNLIVEVWWAAAILWFALLLMGVVDILTNNLARSSKIFWIAAAVFVPLAGLFAYCLFCLTRVDFHMLRFLLRKPKSTRRRDSGASLSTS